MDVLYIPQLDEIGTGGGGDSGGEGGGGSGGTAARYRMLRRVPEDGVVVLTDRAVTRVDIATDGGPLRLVAPPEAKGTARDFFVRLVITADEIPEVTFAPPVAGPAGALAGGGYSPTGETISFEDVDDDVFKCETGVNVFAFTELDNGIFIVNRKMVDIDQEVEFDPCGNAPERSGGDLAEGDREAARQGARVLDGTTLLFKLGAQYSALPKPTMAGYSFLGWFTEAEGICAGQGPLCEAESLEHCVKVEATDRCKTGVTKLYAHWAEYVDSFVDAICAARNLTFFSESESPWFVDGDGAARSGPIGDDGSTTLATTVQGAGTLAFRWRSSIGGFQVYPSLTARRSCRVIFLLGRRNAALDAVASIILASDKADVDVGSLHLVQIHVRRRIAARRHMLSMVSMAVAVATVAGESSSLRIIGGSS